MKRTFVALALVLGCGASPQAQPDSGPGNWDLEDGGCPPAFWVPDGTAFYAVCDRGRDASVSEASPRFTTVESCNALAGRGCPLPSPTMLECNQHPARRICSNYMMCTITELNGCSR